MMTLAIALLLVQVQDQDLKIEKCEKGFARLIATSANFTIKSDAPEESVKAVAKILEDHLRAFQKEFKDQLVEEERPPFKVSIYATYAAFKKANPMADGAGGFYDPQKKRLHVPMEQPRDDDWKWVLRHEATHQLTHLRLGIGGEPTGMAASMPSMWFNEGFASYWAETKWEGDAVQTGGVPGVLLGEYRKMKEEGKLLTLNKLMSRMPDMMNMRAYYAQGWALCHFLRHGKYAPKFAAYLVQQRKGETSIKAFKAAFGIEDLDAFEKEFQGHVDGLKAPRRVY